MTKRTIAERLEVAAGWFFGALGGYVMLRGVDIARALRVDRAEPIPEHVRVTVAPPTVDAMPGFVGPSGELRDEVVDATFEDAPSSARDRRS